MCESEGNDQSKHAQTGQCPHVSPLGWTIPRATKVELCRSCLACKDAPIDQGFRCSLMY